MKAFLTAALLLAAGSAAAADRVETVRFARGADSAELRGTVRGYDVVEYRIDARAGQAIEAALRREHGPAYFSVWAPGSEEAMFFGPSAGNRFAATLPADGEYRLRVFMMRSAARRGERADYRLTLRIR